MPCGRHLSGSTSLPSPRGAEEMVSVPSLFPLPYFVLLAERIPDGRAAHPVRRHLLSQERGGKSAPRSSAALPPLTSRGTLSPPRPAPGTSRLSQNPAPGSGAAPSRWLRVSGHQPPQGTLAIGTATPAAFSYCPPPRPKPR